MKFDAILFDLDGTLLPMDYNEFTKGYLSLLAKAVAPYGYVKDTLIAAMWKGVAAMVRNDGGAPNADRFWQVFASILGEHVYADIPKFDDFYSHGFHNAKSFTQPTPFADKSVKLAREKAGKVVLATNPLFPRVAVNSRLEWAGVAPESFDLITDYENSSFCKPNPAYYTEIVTKLGADAKNCLMIGNNADEDIAAAQALGMSTFLLTDCLIAKGAIPDTPKGNFSEKE